MVGSEKNEKLKKVENSDRVIDSLIDYSHSYSRLIFVVVQFRQLTGEFIAVHGTRRLEFSCVPFHVSMCLMGTYLEQLRISIDVRTGPDRECVGKERRREKEGGRGQNF